MTTGEKLVELSSLGTGTAIEHLMAITTGLNAPSIYNIDITNTGGIGVSDGEITISATGGTQPYLYSLGGAYQVDNIFNNLGEGTYTISVRDVSGYTDTISGIRVSSPSSETPIITELLIIDTSTKITTDGSIRVVADGGLAPYTYSLNNGSYQTDSLFSNLGIGIYSVTIKDSDNVINTLSGIKVGAKVTGGKTGGYGRGYGDRHKIYVNVKNVKVIEKKELKENITVRVTL